MARVFSPAQTGGRKPVAAAETAGSGKPQDRRFQVTLRIVLAARRWRSLLDERLRTIGQSAPRMEAMASIDRTPKPSTQVEIAKRIGIEGPTLTRMLDMLEAEWLVERLPDPSDRRAKLIRLTDEGRQALAETQAIAGALRDQLLAEFSEEELDLINALVGRILARFDDGTFTGPTR